MLLSAPLLLPMPNGLDPRHAALTEPMAVGLHAVNKSAIQPGEAALVIGCGPIGIAIIAALRHRGVESIVAADYSSKRRELAETMGAHQTVDPAQGSPFDTVEPGGGVRGRRRARASSTTSAPRPGRQHGWSSPGCAWRPTPCMPFFATAKEINVQFVFAYDPAEFAESLRAIAEGDIDVAPLITGEVGLDAGRRRVRRAGAPRRRTARSW